MRIQKYISMAGGASRRAAEKLIAEGRVSVNGVTVREVVSVDEDDTVCIDGKPLSLPKENTYIVFNKPRGCICTARDPEGRRTVMDYIHIPQRVYPVGRLDYDTSGLLILTDDGELAARLMHPGSEIEKSYVASVHGEVTEEKLRMLEEGVPLDGRMTAPAKAEYIESEDGGALIRMIIHEGRNRQVRRMLEYVGLKTLRLRRERVGNLKLRGLKSGEYRNMDKDEIESLKRLAGMI